MRYGKLLAALALMAMTAVAYAQDNRPGRSEGVPFDLAQGKPFDSAQDKPFDSAQDKPFDFAQGKPFDFAQDKPEYVRMFAPVRAHPGAYRTYVSPLDLQTVLRRLVGDASFLRPPGAWTPLAQLPSDAFGQTGSYDRWKMAKLYGSRRAMVARGPRSDGQRPTEAWTLVSPYPDPDLEKLEPGTLLIVLELPQE